MIKDLVFLLYDNRSGSTLLASLLNQFSGVSVSHETGFVSRTLEYNKPFSIADDVKNFLSYLNKEVQFMELNPDLEILQSELARKEFPLSKKAVISTILETYFNQIDPNACIWVVKGPRIYFHTRSIRKLFPCAKFINIVRDGRAVYNSKKKMRSVNGRYTQNNLIKAASDWKKRIYFSKKLGGTVKEIRYEDLVEKTEDTLTKLLDFIGVAEQGRFITKSPKNYAENIGTNQKHLHGNVSKLPQKDIITNWQTTLPPSEILLYEWLAGKTLVTMGYQLMYRTKRAPISLKLFALLKSVYFAFHLLWKLGSNICWHIFVERSFIHKCRTKINDLLYHRP